MLTRTVTLTMAGMLLLGLAVAGCSNSNSPTTPTGTTGGPGGGTTTADVTITINGMNGSQSFSPNPATVKAGQTVAWRNADNTTHTATADGGAFDTGGIAPGTTSAAITMPNAGTFPYHCSIHPTMIGTLTVTQ